MHMYLGRVTRNASFKALRFLTFPSLSHRFCDRNPSLSGFQRVDFLERAFRNSSGGKGEELAPFSVPFFLSLRSYASRGSHWDGNDGRGFKDIAIRDGFEGFGNGGDEDSESQSKFGSFVESKVAHSAITRALQSMRLPPKGRFRRTVNHSVVERKLNALLKPWFGCVNNYQARLVLKELSDPLIAIKFFQWVKSQNGFTPDEFVCGELIQLLGKRKWFAEMELVYLRMRENGVPPTPEIYSEMVEAYCSHGWILKSLVYYMRMTDVGFAPDMQTFKALIDACSNQGYWKECLKLYMEMLAFGVKPDYSFCAKIMEICAQLGEMEKAMAVFNYMNESDVGVTPEAYNFMMNAFILHKDIQTATMLFEEMIKKEIPPDLTTYSVLMAGYKSRRMKKEATFMLRELGVLGDVEEYNDQIKSFVKSGKMDSALRVFKEMEESNALPDQFTYSYLIHGCIKAHKFHDAQYLINAMREEMLLPCLNAYSNALLEYLKCDDAEDPSTSPQIWNLMEKLEHPVHKLLSLLTAGSLKEESWSWVAIYIDELVRETLDEQVYFANLLMDYVIKSISRRCALRMYGELRKKGIYHGAFERTFVSWTVNLHDIPPSVALVALRFEFGRLHRLAKSNVVFPRSVFVFIGLGWQSHVQVGGDLKNAVVLWLRSMAAPFTFLHGSEGKMHARGYKVKEWLLNAYIEPVMDSVEESLFQSFPQQMSIPPVTQESF